MKESQPRGEGMPAAPKMAKYQEVLSPKECNEATEELIRLAVEHQKAKPHETPSGNKRERSG